MTDNLRDTQLKTLAAKLSTWIRGDIIAFKTHKTYPERVVVTKYEDRYTVFRGFVSNTGEAYVSVDLDTGSPDTVIAHLVGKLA